MSIDESVAVVALILQVERIHVSCQELETRTGLARVTHKGHNDQLRRRLVLLSLRGDVLEGSLRDPLDALCCAIAAVQEE